ncbi:MAG TPA: AAA family ATPase [Polyangium sp.]|nr:AAA family ATPase [Polyangium sp.]
MDLNERIERRKRWGDRVPCCVIFIGVPAAGKSTFFKTRFVDTHIRINRDMLRTAPRERLLIDACLEGGTSFVVDKTNVLRAERQVFIEAALQAGFVVQGYFFESRKDACIERNARRADHERVPELAILGMRSKLEYPSRAEGFAELYFVKIVDGQTIVEEYRE